MKLLFAFLLALACAHAGKVTLPLSKRASFGEPLVGAADVYMAHINVGTPPVEFLVMLDTGSSDLFLMTDAQPDSCSNCEITGPLYKANASSTAIVSTTPVSLSYLKGETSGVVVQDVVSFGTFKANQVFRKFMKAFHNITPIGEQTGLLGLAWQTAAQTNSTPFIENLWRT
ncbi:hypothetical protein RQP46_008890 [Phenoliferia psychrophenolica]